jgi:hypothetical protein
VGAAVGPDVTHVLQRIGHARLIGPYGTMIVPQFATVKSAHPTASVDVVEQNVDGAIVGANDGIVVGAAVGSTVGTADGTAVGDCEHASRYDVSERQSCIVGSIPLWRAALAQSSLHVAGQLDRTAGAYAHGDS